ncbi:PhoP/PhoQ regulator MgrB [Edaphovirga cremea]|nr:PhoP/PhoQ regulator MgrB [Edaphovirga cremea]
MRLKKVLTVVAVVAACMVFYLLALNSYCDQGGNFTQGVCAITSFIPF